MTIFAFIVMLGGSLMIYFALKEWEQLIGNAVNVPGEQSTGSVQNLPVGGSTYVGN